jgi:glucokinase
LIPQSTTHLIGIDLGGTNIKGALFDASSGECLDRATSPTRDGEKDGDLPAWSTGVRKLVEQFEAQARTANLPIGISAPGLAARDGTCISWMPGRMHGLEGFQWSDFLQRPARVLNDAHAAILGEVWQGAAAGSRDAVMLTLGTGVGGAVISDGRLLTGHLGRAGHLGHITVDHHGSPGITGTPSSLEDAVGNATVTTRSQGRFTSTRALLEAVLAGDADAHRVWDTSVHALAAGMVSLINCFDPETFILGGGIAAGAAGLLTDPLQALLDRMEWRPGGHRVKLVLATLGEWAGATGAAWYAGR